MIQDPPGYSIGAVARVNGVAPWQVRRSILRGFLAEPARIGPYRVFTPAQLPDVRRALIEAGYVHASEVSPATPIGCAPEGR